MRDGEEENGSQGRWSGSEIGQARPRSVWARFPFQVGGASLCVWVRELGLFPASVANMHGSKLLLFQKGRGENKKNGGEGYVVGGVETLEARLGG